MEENKTKIIIWGEGRSSIPFKNPDFWWMPGGRNKYHNNNKKIPNPP